MRISKFKIFKKKDKQKSQEIKPPKPQKTKIKWYLRIANYLKLLAKDLKRSRWANVSDSGKTFVKVSIFIIIVALALYGLAIGFLNLWSTIGVGPDG